MDVGSSTEQNAAIYEEVSHDLVRFASSLVGPDDAPDAVSTVVARALAGGGLVRLENPRAYLTRSVHNECRTIHRKRRRDGEATHALAGTSQVEPDGPSQMAAVVAALPFKQRCATHLVYWMGYSPTEAARLMGVRPATLRRYLHLARKKVKEAIDVTGN